MSVDHIERVRYSGTVIDWYALDFEGKSGVVNNEGLTFLLALSAI